MKLSPQEVNEKARELLAVLDNYLGFHGRVTGLVGAARGNLREIAGLDAAADLKRTSSESTCQRRLVIPDDARGTS